MNNCLRLLFVCLAALLFAGAYITRAQAQAGSKVFSHTTKAHRTGKYADCSTCHRVPTPNWIKPRLDKEDPFPDVIDFPVGYNKKNGKPDHSACIGCHSGDMHSNPSFCAGCHTMKSKSVLSVTGMMAFPNRARPTQFETIFPHDVHQDAFASNDRRYGTATGHFVFASFTVAEDEKKPEFYNSAVCHDSAATLPKFLPRKPEEPVKPSGNNSVYPFGRPDTSDPFKPTADFFKDVPKNHASCFNCHYRRTEPTATNCDGCHKLADKPYFESNTIERYSLKFSHDEKDKDGKWVHAKDCMSCHLRTAGSSDLKALKNKSEPEVPFSTCVSCHSSDITDQFDKRDKDKNFQCNYCHVSAIGRYEKPESHHE